MPVISLYDIAARAAGLARSKLTRFVTASEQGLRSLQAVEVRDVLSDEQVGVSWVGRPVFSDLRFLPGSFTDAFGQEVTYEGMVLQDPLITVTRSKQIVTTPVQGLGGTVKEHITTGDYMVSVTYVLASNNANVYPADLVEQLVGLLELNTALRVEGRLFELLGIYSLVIEGYDLPPTSGFNNIQAVSFKALSDTPIELQPLDI